MKTHPALFVFLDSTESYEKSILAFKICQIKNDERWCCSCRFGCSFFWWHQTGWNPPFCWSVKERMEFENEDWCPCSGYPGMCNAGEGDARSVHHTDVHLLGQAVLALLAWLLDARAGVNELVLLALAGADVDLLVLVLAGADVDKLVLDTDEA